MNAARALARVQAKVTSCRRCPRLVGYIAGIRKQHPDYWCKPVPGFGDPKARLLLLGLAPGRFGSNRTGRMFTGDASGKFLYRALFELGLCNQPDASDRNDGLRLRGVYITAVARCAPPQNKPEPAELARCAPFLSEELGCLPNLSVVAALGRIAHDSYLKLAGRKRSEHPFRHGAVHFLQGRPALVDVYHPSRQNTQTGLLTLPMFKQVLKRALDVARSRA